MDNFEEVYNRQIDTVLKICVMYLKNIDDAEEIVEILDMKSATVRSNLYRARKLLKISLANEYSHER